MILWKNKAKAISQTASSSSAFFDICHIRSCFQRFSFCFSLLFLDCCTSLIVSASKHFTNWIEFVCTWVQNCICIVTHQLHHALYMIVPFLFLFSFSFSYRKQKKNCTSHIFFADYKQMHGFFKYKDTCLFFLNYFQGTTTSQNMILYEMFLSFLSAERKHNNLHIFKWKCLLYKG